MKGRRGKCQAKVSAVTKELPPVSWQMNNPTVGINNWPTFVIASVINSAEKIAMFLY